MQQQGNTAPMEHVHEASRRMALMETYANKPLEKPVFSDCIPNLDADRSKRPVLLYNVAQEGCSPTPKDPHNPAMRLLGVFDDAAEAVAAAQVLARKSEPIDYWTTPIGDWFMLHRDRQASVGTRIDDRLEQHRVRRDRDFSQLKVARDKKLQSRTSFHKQERAARALAAAAAAAVDTPDNAADAANTVRGLAAKFVRLNQRFCVISVLPDTGSAVRIKQRIPEPLVRVYGAFPSKKEATVHIKEVLAQHIGDYDLDVVDMYEWLFPQSVDAESLVEEFRDPEINNIMQHAKEEKKTTRAFRERCALTGQEPDMAYITGNEPIQSVQITESLPESVTEMLHEEANAPTLWELQQRDCDSGPSVDATAPP